MTGYTDECMKGYNFGETAAAFKRADIYRYLQFYMGDLEAEANLGCVATLLTYGGSAEQPSFWF